MLLHKSTFIFALSACIVFVNCTDESGPKDNFDRGLILENVADNIIIPAFSDFSTKTTVLKNKLESFSSAPSLETLAEAKVSWKAAKTAWKKVEMFKFGPVDQLAYETSLDFWPTSAAGIENEIVSFDSSENYLEGVGSNKKGFPAIEYLLYHDDAQVIISEFTNEKRTGFLNALAQKLESQSKEILAAWQGDYRATFVSNTGNDAGAGATLLANDMLILIETVKNKKVNTPAGLIAGSQKYPKQVEAYYSKISTELIIANLESVKEVFTGKGGNGFDDYLDALNIGGNNSTKLSTDIVAQIDACIAAANEISDPFQEAIYSEETKIQTLFVAVQQLTVLMKTDMMSQLGLIVTFSDSDGD
jgi:uncharacterized protein